MAIKRIAPALEGYTAELSANMNEKKKAIPELECSFEKEIITEMSGRTDRIYSDVQKMVSVLDSLSGEDYFRDAEIIRDSLLPEMTRLREDSDAAERLTSKKFWPLPNYGLLLFGEK
jgi:glutamine synthetase